MAELLGASDEEVAALVEAYRQTKGDERQGT
jgi:hypothetical protein